MSSFKCSVCEGRFARGVRELKGNGLGDKDRKLAWWATGNFRKSPMVGRLFFIFLDFCLSWPQSWASLDMDPI